MIVARRTYVAKPGKNDQMKEVLFDLIEKNPWSGGNTRVYTSHIGPYNHIIVENESESLAAFEKAQSQFTQGVPEGVFDTWQELEASASIQMWKLEYERRVED